MTAKHRLLQCVSATVCLILLSTGCHWNQRVARTHLARGTTALSDHQLQVALAEFREAVKLDPEFAEAHAKLGIAYKETGDLDQAATSLESAVRLDPFSFTPMFELGEVYRLLDRLSQAIRAYVLACKLAPRDFDAHFRLASCYHRSGELEQAALAYEQALKLEQNNAFAWSNLGAVYDVQGSAYEAIRAYKRSLECQGAQPVVLVNLATVYINQERYATARRTLDAAIRLDPKLSVAHERLGYCQWREQRLDDAIGSYERALSLSNRNSRAFAGLGVVRMTQYLNEPEQMVLRSEAVEAWHQSLEIDPAQPQLRTLIEKYRIPTERPLLSIDD